MAFESIKAALGFGKKTNRVKKRKVKIRRKTGRQLKLSNGSYEDEFEIVELFLDLATDLSDYDVVQDSGEVEVDVKEDGSFASVTETDATPSSVDSNLDVSTQPTDEYPAPNNSYAAPSDSEPSYSSGHSNSSPEPSHSSSSHSDSSSYSSPEPSSGGSYSSDSGGSSYDSSSSSSSSYDSGSSSSSSSDSGGGWD